MKKLSILLLITISLTIFSGCITKDSDDTTPRETTTKVIETENGAVEIEVDAETGTPVEPIPEDLPPEARAQLNGEGDLPFVNVLPEEAKEIIDTNGEVVIIDVSSAYTQGHIPGAINIPLADLESRIAKLDKSKEHLVYCNFDSSAAIAGAQKLAEAGFETIYRLEGNLGGWVSAGFETVK